jgi:ribonuclease P protein component
LPDADAFSHVFAKASRSRDNLFTVLSRNNGTAQARLGLAISKKHCRRACDRNRLKRLVRESFRLHATTLQGLDIVVLGQPDASGADNRSVFSSLARHWQKTRSANPRLEP